MEITVKLYSRLRTYAPGDHHVFRVCLPGGAMVDGLLERLEIPAAVQRTILINGRRAEESASLSPGDEVVMMPLIDGG